jgi:hypothetical protein
VYKNKKDFGEIIRATTASNGFEYVLEVLIDDGDELR